MDERIFSLNERAKELECLYQIEAALSSPNEALSTVCYAIVRAIPPGWQYPEICTAQIRLEHEVFSSGQFESTPWQLTQSIVVDGDSIGEIQVCYTEPKPEADFGPFLREEAQLIATIASRIAHYLHYVRLSERVQRHQAVQRQAQTYRATRWQAVIDTLRHTDGEMYVKVSRRMATHLFLRGVLDAEELLRRFGSGVESAWPGSSHASHLPAAEPDEIDSALGADVFDLAARQLDDAAIMDLIQKWVREDQLSTLERIVSTGSSWSAIRSALRRVHPLESETMRPESASHRGLQVALVRRLLSDQLHFINAAKDCLDIPEIYLLLDRVISCSGSLGRLGEKSAGLLLAHRILQAHAADSPGVRDVRVPRAWYITSEGILHFIQHNGFDEFIEQKYKSSSEIEAEYPYVQRAFASAQLPSDITSALSVVLDDMGNTPLIVRSSSLLEGSVGASFSGKYDSVFLTNTGTKTERLRALRGAIARVYASTLNPEALAYRANHGFIDLVEEMGVLIQQVVGRQVGEYYLPTISGVAFSQNDMQWAPGVNSDSGLIRLIPGLGSRAVVRVGNECPVIMTAFGRPIRYQPPVPCREPHQPRTLEVMNPGMARIETIRVDHLLHTQGEAVPEIEELTAGTGRRGTTSRRSESTGDAGALAAADVVRTVGEMVKVLEQTLGYPVEIEFSSDGHHVYLLQCRPQNRLAPEPPPPLPATIARNDLILATNRFVTTDFAADIRYLVFIDPDRYPALEEDLGPPAIGRLLRHINLQLPRGQYMIVGPAYSDDYGSVLFGATIRYSSISRCRLLVEISHDDSDCRPESIYGSHFYKDLIEGDIRYLPLYPSGGERMLNLDWLRNAPNMLDEVTSEFSHASDALKVIDIDRLHPGSVVHVVMNRSVGRAVAVLTRTETERPQ